MLLWWDRLDGRRCGTAKTVVQQAQRRCACRLIGSVKAFSRRRKTSRCINQEFGTLRLTDTLKVPPSTKVVTAAFIHPSVQRRANLTPQGGMQTVGIFGVPGTTLWRRLACDRSRPFIFLFRLSWGLPSASKKRFNRTNGAYDRAETASAGSAEHGGEAGGMMLGRSLSRESREEEWALRLAEAEDSMVSYSSWFFGLGYERRV